MKVAMYPGTFDPLTNGHVDIARRASVMFDKLYVCVANNPHKKTYFTIEERLEMAKVALQDITNIEVIATQELVVKEAKKRGAIAIIRGLRAVSDFEFEFQLAAGNEFLDKEIERVFLMSSSGLGFISSSAIKEFVYHAIDIQELVPPIVVTFFKNKAKKLIK